MEIVALTVGLAGSFCLAFGMAKGVTLVVMRLVSTP